MHLLNLFDDLTDLYIFYKKLGMGIGDWGLGIGDWAQSPIPNPQSPIPNPHYIKENKTKNNFSIKFIF